jgi:hypothetical protein
MEAIRRGVKASIAGTYFSNTDIQNFGLNKTGSACLFIEAYSHQLYALGCVAAHTCRNDKWATHDFFVDSVLEGMQEAVREGGFDTEELLPTLLKRYGEFELYEANKRIQGEHFKASAELVAKQDSTADINAIYQALSSSTQQYMANVARMFGVN